jgi:8-oxo-dGTP diphosphatase
MILSTLCYLEKDNQYLMLHRTKKENDINKDKWLGVGGKFEEGESPEECIQREVKEETGFTLKSQQLRGIVTYVSTTWETEYMYVFTSNDFTGELIECNEGDLQWIEKTKVNSLNTWEGDKYIVKEIQQGTKFFTIKFNYDGEKLINYRIENYS